MPKEAGFGREGKAKANGDRFPGLPIEGVSALWSRRPKWWNGIHIRLKICRRKAYRFESGLGHGNTKQAARVVRPVFPFPGQISPES